MKKILLTILLVCGVTVNLSASNKPTLLFYCGITMVKPMVEISKIIEKKHNCTIKIIQGGSKDLYQSLSYSKKGDIYLPGSDSYRKKYLKEGYLLDSQEIGFNQAAIFIRKGNPKNIKNLKSLVDENISTILCNPNSGSIGKMTKKILNKYKGADFFDEAYDLAVEIGTDSRNLNKALIDKKVDMTINWRATAFWSENSPYIDIIEIDQKYAPKKKLVLNLLKFSNHPKIALDLMKFASSQEGIKIMQKYGFR
ncbi:MAG: substrate-binding domain-containing protein [Campylobacterota bacterium]|nr:substrate-binding domain-containing protein [Campylobacterota bacterium]